jgi:FIMAH domain
MPSTRAYSIPTNFLFVAVLALGLAFGSLVWASDPPTQGLVTQVQQYSATGEIYEAAAADDLLAMLASVDKAISQGDNVAAQDLLAGFVHAVRGLEGKLISTAAASSLVTAADALSVSL